MTEKGLGFSLVVWEKVITDTKMSASRAEKAMEVAALLLTDEDALRKHLSHTPSSDEEMWWC